VFVLLVWRGEGKLKFWNPSLVRPATKRRRRRIPEEEESPGGGGGEGLGEEKALIFLQSRIGITEALKKVKVRSVWPWAQLG
jgi:hypothetical protein